MSDGMSKEPPRPSILVVDDDADARMIMRSALRKAGFEVRTADSGEAALSQFREQACDLVMLDVDMPGLGGHEVCAMLRAEAGPLLPIVMVTGMDDMASVETAYDHGATDFIAKPVNWALIGYRVRYLLRGSRAMLDLRSAEARNAAILNAIPDLLFEVDIDGRYLDFRAPQEELLAAPADTLIGRNVADVMPADAAQRCMAALHEALQHGSSAGVQFELPLPKGKAWFELSVSRKVVAVGAKPRFIVLSRDITERKQAEMRIAKLAYFDSLTGLPNRQSFLDQVNRNIHRAQRNHSQLAVLFLDLDGFKHVNDTLGHGAGDLILQWAAERLTECLRPTDVLARADDSGGSPPCNDIELARLGGDEFTALILGVAHAEEALAVARRIGAMMRRPFMLNGSAVTLTTSIGIALYPQDGADADTLLKHADTAMYHAKNLGRDNAQMYCASLTAEAMQRMELDASLRAALDRGEFHLLYQPKIDVASGRADSVEALIRWTHPTRGLIPPLDFIPLAEENGLIERIGHWVLRTACADAMTWLLAGHHVSVAVNLSPLQFKDQGLQQSVVDVLAISGLPPELLELEFTESALMEHPAATIATLHALRGLGVHIALDDFGTGYSSLSYLTRMPISNLKVDRSFISGLLEGGENEAVVRAVLAMATSLGMRVTAEGVETLAQAQALRAMACDSLQGYYFSRPVPAFEIPGLLARNWARDLTLDDTAPPPAASNAAASFNTVAQLRVVADLPTLPSSADAAALSRMPKAHSR